MDTVTPILDNVTDSLPGSLSTLANNLVDSLLGPENILVDLFNQGGDTDIHVSLLSDFGIFDGGPLALDIPIDPLESLVGDIDISLDNILDLDNLASGDFLSSALNINTEILPDISEAININDLPGNVESVVEDVPALVEDIVTSLPETLDELLGQDDGVLEGVDNIVASVLGDDIGAPVIPDTIDDVLGGILNPGTPDNSDQDLTLLGDISILGADIPLPGVDINLDIVEGIVGDIDVNADLNLDILTGADECDDLVTTLLGDAGLELDADIELLTGLTGSDSVAAGDLGGVVDNITDTLWPESSIIDALGDIASGNLGGGGGTSLPEPVGVITDTIGTVTETLPLGGLLSGGGGGGGHHHFGGLFG